MKFVSPAPDNVCLRPWAFERVPNRMIRGLDRALIYTSTKEACLAACLNEVGGSAGGRDVQGECRPSPWINFIVFK